MENTPNTETSFSRTKLEGLSNSELIKLADSYGIDIPRALERIFIIEELLEYSNANNTEEKDDLKIDPSYSETAALPKQYNISYIEVKIRDPLWVFVYWEIKAHDREIHENAEDFKGYCLRVVPVNEGETETTSKENSFTIPIEVNDCARYLGLAEHSSGTRDCYIVKLGVIRGDLEFQIAASQPFCLPLLIDNDRINSMNENPLIRLCAVDDLSIIKNMDRQSKTKRE